ncbi:hypothetical protein SAMN04488029_3398 [Reichenbachiella faecimaris]|uniref:Uncharacterized protein n=1 Tax=Reichenbachiella faecimaris TaxID=692418 RepID=A0A1W2GMI9_REIFA|nr:hypothetical protein [Reichenbachiella faecimaris]SMD37662.1 hypothetical protein SAMN04488029_3398 [Reichenbachiella faecimaris]
MGAYKDRKIALKNLGKLVEDPSKVLCVHYSQSQTYDDDYGNISPIITSIVIKSLDDKIDKQFAIHFEADKAGIPKDQIQDSYRELELRILKSFNDFVKRHDHCIWVHWDMKNIHFGFEAIKHRYEKLFEGLNDYHEIPSHSKHSLYIILEGMYGEGFVNGPDQFKELMTSNNSGVEQPVYLAKEIESSEFESKNFKSVIDSVDCKVEFLKKAVKKLINRKLTIQNKNRYAMFLDVISHPVFNLIGWVATLGGLILALYSIFK